MSLSDNARPWRYRQVVGGRCELHLALLTAIVGLGYFFVWILFGMAVYPLAGYPLNVAQSAVEVRSATERLCR